MKTEPHDMMEVIEIIEIVEIIDLEIHCKTGKPAHARKYRIRIDKAYYEVHQPTITGRALLELAGKVPVANYDILQKHHCAEPQNIGLDDVVDLRKPGVERFITIPHDQTEGHGPLRRGFELGSEDREFLEAQSLAWEAVLLPGSVRRIVFKDFPIPEGYNTRAADMNLRLEAGYPDTQIDMAYFFPALARLDGKGIGALTTDSFDGRVWQRWSRHRTTANPWRPGLDNIETHLALVKSWLELELKK